MSMPDKRTSQAVYFSTEIALTQVFCTEPLLTALALFAPHLLGKPDVNPTSCCGFNFRQMNIECRSSLAQ
ncbi:MAG TPA: hypothetical protein DDY14_00685 [Chromatiaceae bacterium]|nr:MAG: hypothetical protein N838_00705 [Thiohalocapsa sp. PB-PSB1]HBG93850.1 hypothetical protein [Chromatiaceae bacterium]HCS90111.1 hypothetical protein [Chromatiaceae bacterium]